MAKTWAGAVAELLKCNNDELEKIKKLDIPEEERNKKYDELQDHWDKEFEKINKKYPRETRFKDTTEEGQKIVDEVFERAEECLKKLDKIEAKMKVNKK